MYRKLSYILMQVCSIFILSMAPTGCVESTDSVPLPKAWPRLPIVHSDTMVLVDSLPVRVRINPSAVPTRIEGNTAGLTVSYPNTGAKIYFTFIPVHDEGERQKIVSNRHNRMSLNLNGVPAETVYSEDGNSMMVVAQSAALTPVQFLASLTDYVVSATAFIDNGSQPIVYDSIYPLVQVLENDLRCSLPDSEPIRTTTR